jgi:hypothetical protein
VVSIDSINVPFGLAGVTGQPSKVGVAAGAIHAAAR